MKAAVLPAAARCSAVRLSFHPVHPVNPVLLPWSCFAPISLTAEDRTATRRPRSGRVSQSRASCPRVLLVADFVSRQRAPAPPIPHSPTMNCSCQSSAFRRSGWGVPGPDLQACKTPLCGQPIVGRVRARGEGRISSEQGELQSLFFIFVLFGSFVVRSSAVGETSAQRVHHEEQEDHEEADCKDPFSSLCSLRSLWLPPLRRVVAWLFASTSPEPYRRHKAGQEITSSDTLSTTRPNPNPPRSSLIKAACPGPIKPDQTRSNRRTKYAGCTG
jgi:hypothetical protein